MQIKNVNDVDFKVYGRVLESVDTKGIAEAMKNTPVPSDVIYVPSDKELESTPLYNIMSDSIYGGMPVQIGYCNGHNQKLNGLEYHRSSEIDIAVTDLILLIGRQQDIEQNYTYDTAKAEAFFVPAGCAVELYATTLHYAPCGIEGSGFKCVVVLPKGTNYDVTPLTDNGEDRLLAATNKWLIAHSEAHIEGAFVGLKGENISV